MIPDRRLIAADILKLRRRRGMLTIAALLTVGVMVVATVVTAVQHLADPAQYGPAGGLSNYREGLAFITTLALVIGTIVGATAGSQDLETGVFRDLAATGRSRSALFLSSAAAACAIAVPLLVLTAAVGGTSAVLLAGDLRVPDAGELALGTGATAAAAALSAAVAAGTAVLVGSRGAVIGILLAFYLAIQPLLIAMTFLGEARQVLPEVAIKRLGELPGADDLGAGPAGAAAVVIAWSLLALVVGVWRTSSREI